jgi:hypothetical protein
MAGIVTQNRNLPQLVADLGCIGYGSKGPAFLEKVPVKLPVNEPIMSKKSVVQNRQK